MLSTATRRRLEPPAIQSAHLPAPLGGINRVDPASAMPAADAVFLYNLIAAELGLVTRPGSPEWATGITGALANVCRTQLPFTGTSKNGSGDGLFQTSTTGIWDVSASTARPTLPVTFPTQSGDAGRGVCHAYSTLAGRFFLYTDEENGLYVYTEVSRTWAKVALGAGVLWVFSTAYAVGDRVRNGVNTYVCAVAGTSAGSGGPTGTTAGITDGSVTWNWVEAFSATAIGPSLFDQRAGYTGDPANFAFVTVFKDRVWFVEKDTTRAWYSGIGQLYGTYTSFNFGSKMRAGGDLRGLFNWSYDAGNGLDTLLVGISGGGDAVIYGGTDPASSSTFGLKGVWYVGAVPRGRRIATDYGGELLVLSMLGITPLSKLVAGGSLEDKSLYATRKIQPLFNTLVSTYRTVPGWSLCIHPEANCLLVTVPTVEDAPCRIFAMSFSTKGWGEWRDLRMVSCASWNGTVFFGTDDGRVQRSTGATDDAKLADVNDSKDIQWSALTAYQNLGNARQKQIQLVEPILLSDTASPVVEAWAKYDFDLIEPDPPVGNVVGSGGGAFDSAKFDEAVFGGENTASASYFGGAGLGKHVAIAVRGKANSKTTLVGFNVSYTQGGLL